MISARQALPKDVNPRQFAMGAPTVDTSQYAKYEKGGALGMDKLMELCSAWGISEDWLLTGKGAMFSDKSDKSLEVHEFEVGYNSESSEKESLDKLSQALADQAEANKIQAIANKENAEAINKLASAIQSLGLNFGTILSTQDAGFGLVAELVSRQVHKDANGNEEKVKSDLDEIAQRIGQGLGPIARKGIAVHDGK